MRHICVTEDFDILQSAKCNKTFRKHEINQHPKFIIEHETISDKLKFYLKILKTKHPPFKKVEYCMR